VLGNVFKLNLLKEDKMLDVYIYFLSSITHPVSRIVLITIDHPMVTDYFL